MGFRDLFRKKPVIGIMAHPLVDPENIYHVHGSVVVAYFPRAQRKQASLEVIGRLVPHESEVRVFLHKVDESRADAAERGEKGASAEPVTAAPGFSAMFLDGLKRSLAAGKITLEGYQSVRDKVVSRTRKKTLDGMREEAVAKEEKRLASSGLNNQAS